MPILYIQNKARVNSAEAIKKAGEKLFPPADIIYYVS